MDKDENQPIKECRLYVDGMHCASCEVLIEKKILKYDGVEFVDASLKDNKVRISYSRKQPQISELNKEFQELGYKFQTKKVEKKATPVLRFNPDGSLSVNKGKLFDAFKVSAIFFSLIIAFFLFEKLSLGKYVSVQEGSALPAFFMLGLVAGASSCAALVGGILLSMTKQWHELYIDSDSNAKKAQPHIMFHTGRLLSYAVLGGMLGLIGDVISLNNTTVYSILVIVISVVMFLLALQMLDVKWAHSFRLRAPKFVGRFVSEESNFQGRFMPFVTGVLTFFLPCGFTLIAQSIALTTGSFIQGGLIMFLFALGTFPLLALISMSGLKFNSKPYLTARFNKIAGLLIVFFVIYNINSQLNVLGLPSLSDIKLRGESKVESIVELDEQGEQRISMIAQGFEYLPTSSMVIRQGVLTTLVVDNKGIQGCGAFMAARGLFDGYVQLKYGENIVTFTPKQKGTYKVTCSMGMVAPVLVQVI